MTFILVGSFFVIIAVYKLVSNRSTIKSGEYTVATVVETKRRTAGEYVAYHSVLEYKVNGKTYKAESGGRPRPKYEDGESVKIIYNKQEVEKIHIIGDRVTYVVAVILGLVGIIMLGIGLHMHFS